MRYQKLKLEELKKLCFEKELSTTGKRENLIQRLIDLEENLEKGLQLSIESYAQQDESKKSSKNTLFIHLNSQNLSRYFNSGVIFPLSLEESEIYIKENRKTDVMTKFPQHVILSSQPLNDFKEEDVLIELITEDLEIKELDKDLFFSTDPIPISRIKSLYFKTSAIIKSYVASIKIFPDFYLNEDLCKVLPYNTPVLKVDLNDFIIPENHNLELWRERLLKFDKLMGLFSFMKNTGLFDIKGNSFVFEEYNKSFLNVLSLINSNVQPLSKDIALYRYILFPESFESTNTQRQIFKRVINTIYSDTDFSFPLLKEILKDIKLSIETSSEDIADINVILESIEKLENHKMAFKDLLKIDNIKKNYPILCLIFLARYPNKAKNHTDKQAVRTQFILNEANLPKNTSEFILAVLGLYYGYKSMVKEDTNIIINDVFVANLSKQIQSIKFKLKTTFERVIIESIFHFCKTNNITSDKFSYLNFKSVNSSKNYLFNQNEYIDKSFELFNTRILVFEQIDKSIKILEAIDEKYSNKLNVSSNLLHYLISNFGISKELVMQIIKANSSQLNTEEILALIQFEKGPRKKP